MQLLLQNNNKRILLKMDKFFRYLFKKKYPLCMNFIFKLISKQTHYLQAVISPLFMFSIISWPVYAQNFDYDGIEPRLRELIATHSTINASENDITAATERAKASMGGWYPRINITSHYGTEYQDNFTGDNTSLVTRDLNLNLTQLLWDFGATNAVINSAELQLELVKTQSAITKDNLILRALVAHINVVRSNIVNQFALKSENNIKKQAQLENAMVSKGAGLSTNVLQAKVTLAGAQARRVQAQGALKLAINAYYTLFRKSPKDLEALEKLKLSFSILPPSVDEAISIAFINNRNLKAAFTGIDLVNAAIDISKAGFYPVFEVTGDAKYKKDIGGAVGFEKEYLGKLQFTYPFNLGLTSINTVRASKNDAQAAVKRLSNLKHIIEEQVRSIWINYQTAVEIKQLLKNQANIAGIFLELARKERQLGKRELIEVLAGETNLINAQSDAASAETDVLIAGLTLMSVLGQLNLDILPILIPKT
jgi:adhesin transport system outer membrane protein